ncbi:AAA family ATPase [Hespellia stercorisuis]|uniref:Adenylate kinase n=1 Tax=Hespellia stercorisuis DSM 15480 TaxID=1121950 RepID=A0A1M6QP85_9FIRM|nr:AAA family ATPase [Hespellia stercorisuis]SHK21900.1 Adenylate kinase [Hespellia stercorisuis DSM 15480]
MKIHIIGGSGSGKTYLANRLSEEYNIGHYDLDDLLWDNKADSYGVKRNTDERYAMLQEILNKDNWIIEGVYYKWCKQCFADADRIFLLEVPRHTYRYRIIKRFIRRKLGLEKGKKETLKSLKDLLKWADSYSANDMTEIKKLVEPYENKVIRI